MQEEESSVYPQLVELQQQLQQQLGKRVELSRCHLFWSFFCFGDILVVSIGENVRSLLRYRFKAHQICLPACSIIGSKHVTKYFDQSRLIFFKILVQTTSPNILISLLYYWFKVYHQIF